ncbi:hypothetical protein [Andreprevotia lacus]|uniref:hypothetical protein n=1 Tax=Andreprevotia lacus TaxID=1121000 RepID=UPI00111C2548|nr:hypothetical protein [Andreprevotia lacus]
MEIDFFRPDDDEADAFLCIPLRVDTRWQEVDWHSVSLDALKSMSRPDWIEVPLPNQEVLQLRVHLQEGEDQVIIFVQLWLQPMFLVFITHLGRSDCWIEWISSNSEWVSAEN